MKFNFLKSRKAVFRWLDRSFLAFRQITNHCRKIQFNPYLEHFGDVVERHLWIKNPQSYFYFWWRHTSTKIFNFMIIWDHGSSTIYTSLGLITWRHHLEISRDQQKFIKNPGYMVERHLWTKNPHAFGNVVERRLWTKNPQQIATFDFRNFMKNSDLGTSWSVICEQKIHS